MNKVAVDLMCSLIIWSSKPLCGFSSFLLGFFFFINYFDNNTIIIVYFLRCIIYIKVICGISLVAIFFSFFFLNSYNNNKKNISTDRYSFFIEPDTFCQTTVVYTFAVYYG